MPIAAQLRHRASGEVKIDSDVWVPDDWLGYKLPPGLDTLLEALPEKPYRVRTTSLGYAGIGFRSAERDGRPIAALVGDSFTLAEGVSFEESWPQRLAQRTGWNVLNFGLNGYGPPQYTRMLERYALPLEPRLVLWVFCPNDFENAYDFHRALEEGRGAEGYRERRPTSRADRLWTSLREHSFALDTLGASLRALKRGRPVTVDTGAVKITAHWDYWRRQISVDDPPIREGWEWTQRDLLEARDAARQAGAELVVVIVPFREQVYWDLFEGRLPGWEEADPDAPGELVRSFSQEHGIRVLDLAPAFRERARPGRQLYFSGDGHWNPEGNAFAAEVIADFLDAEGLRPPAASSHALRSAPRTPPRCAPASRACAHALRRR
jgi:hypothetical protein